MNKGADVTKGGIDMNESKMNYSQIAESERSHIKKKEKSKSSKMESH
jgi:hypothetical protein